MTEVIRQCTTCDKPIKTIKGKIGNANDLKNKKHTMSITTSIEGACFLNHWFCNHCLEVMSRLKIHSDKIRNGGEE